MSIASELAAMRADCEAIALPDTATITRYTVTDDGSGGKIESWVSAGSCQVRIGSIKAREQIDLGERWESLSDAVHITYPISVTLNERDRLTVGSRTYSMEDILDNETWALFREAFAIWIQ